MRIIIICEESQKVCIAFRTMGYEAYSCDIKPCSGGHPEWHFQADARDILGTQRFDMMIAHPSCIRLCNSGVRWLHERELWAEMEIAAGFFRYLLDYPIHMKCIENPIPHKYALKIIGRKYDQIIQPWMFGHGETKATCLWLENLPLLKPTKIVTGRENRIHRMPPGKDRSTLRSRTYRGVALAMAEQWGRTAGVLSSNEGI